MNIFYPNLTQGGKAQYAGRGYGGTDYRFTKNPRKSPLEEAPARDPTPRENYREVSHKAHAASTAATEASKRANVAGVGEERSSNGIAAQAHETAALAHQAAGNHMHADDGQKKLHQLHSEFHANMVAHHKVEAFEAPQRVFKPSQAVPNTGYAKAQAHRDAAER